MPNLLDMNGLKKIKNLVSLFKFAKNISQNKTCSTCYNKQGDTCVNWLGEAVGWQQIELPKYFTCNDWLYKNIKKSPQKRAYFICLF